MDEKTHFTYASMEEEEAISFSGTIPRILDSEMWREEGKTEGLARGQHIVRNGPTRWAYPQDQRITKSHYI